MNKLYTILVFTITILFSINSSGQTINTTIGSTGYTANNNSGTGSFITFAIENNTGAALFLTSVGNWTTTAHNGTTSTLYYSSTSLSGPITGNVLPATGWTLVGSATVSGITTSGVNPVITGLNFLVPAGAIYRFALNTTGTNYYSGTGVGTCTPNTFNVSNIVMRTGDYQYSSQYVGYGYSNNPRFFTGFATFIPATPCAGQPSAGVASLIPGCPTSVALSGNTIAGNMSIQWQKKASCNGTWANITGANSGSYTIASQSSSTDYRAYITCITSGLTDTSNIVTVATVTPCYCTSASLYGLYNQITNVTAGTLNNTSSCTSSTYSNFSSVPAPVFIKGTSVPYSVTITNCGSSTLTNGTAVYIDLNKDGMYTVAERVAYSTTSFAGSGVLSGYLAIPSAASTGITGMRVINEYNVAGSSIGGCDNGYSYGETEDYLVNIKYAPTATGAGTYCSGQTVTLTGSSTGYTNPIYLWKYPNNTYVITPSITIPNIQASQAGTYTLYLLTPSSCTNTPPDTSGATIVNVNVNQTPSIPIVAPVIVYCQGDVFDSIPIYGLNLKWYSVPVGGIGDTAKPQINTSVYSTVTYYVSQTVAGCEGPRTPVTINVVAKPSPPQVVSPVNYCQGEPASALTAIGQNIKWYSVSTGGVGTPITPTPTTNAQGTFTWYVSQTVSGCESDRIPVVVTVNYVPNALITITRPFVCQYDTVSLSYYGNANNAADYIWTLPNGATVLSGSGQGPLVIRFDTAGIQTVKLVVDNGGCRGPQASLDVPVHVSPRFGLDLQPDACVGDIVNIAVVYPTTGVDNYNWNNFAGADVIYGAQTAGPYGIRWNTSGDKIVTVVATAASCKSLPVSDTIHVHALPDATITASATSVCAGDSITFSAPYEPGASYQWLPFQFFGESNAATQIGTIDFSKQIILNVTNTYNCRATDSILINAHPCCEVYFPTAFTPNGDGKNDVFRMLTVSKSQNSPGDHQITSFRIENRWGQVVFSTGSERVGWDGTFNGVPQDMGTYYYYVKYKCADGKFYTQKGELTLVR